MIFCDVLICCHLPHNHRVILTKDTAKLPWKPPCKMYERILNIQQFEPFCRLLELDHHQPKVIAQLLGEAGLPDVPFPKKGGRLPNSLQACAVEHLHQQVSSGSRLFCSFDVLLDRYSSLSRVLYFRKCHQQLTMKLWKVFLQLTAYRGVRYYAIFLIEWGSVTIESEPTTNSADYMSSGELCHDSRLVCKPP